MAVKVVVEHKHGAGFIRVEGEADGDIGMVRLDLQMGERKVQFAVRLSDARELNWTLAEVIRLLDAEPQPSLPPNMADLMRLR